VAKDVADTLNRVMRSRVAAGEGALPKSLAPIMELATNPKGATFNGLQRARNTLAQQIDFEAGQGFDVGDLKAAYGAITKAMRNSVEVNAKNGAKTAALSAFDKAEANFGKLADVNAQLSGFSRSGPESLVDRMIQYASDKGGANIGNLGMIRQSIPAQDFAKVSRLAFDRLGKDARGEFSPEALAKNWGGISDEGKRMLFGPNAPRIDAAIRHVNDVSGRMSEANAGILKAMSGTDTEITNRMLAMASSGSKADIDTLRRMTQMFGRDNLKGLSSVAIQRMGAGRDGKFSANYFVTNWAKMSEDGKAFLFHEPEVRKSLDAIAKLTGKIKDAEKFANHSNTGRTIIGAGFLTHAMTSPLSALGMALGGDAVARVLAKPATAQATARWAQRMAALNSKGAKATPVATRLTMQFLNEIGMPQAANDLGHAVTGPLKGAADKDQK